eukprot:5924019-Pyramimonas_sp.AAC.2
MHPRAAHVAVKIHCHRARCTSSISQCSAARWFRVDYGRIDEPDGCTPSSRPPPASARTQSVSQSDGQTVGQL